MEVGLVQVVVLEVEVELVEVLEAVEEQEEEEVVV